MENSDLKTLQNWLNRTINDPLVKILLENSNFSKIQLETLIIDLLSEQIIDKKITEVDKIKVRLDEKIISRGSFNRTLQQARNNMKESIWTILLLGYLGILDTPSLGLFVEASNKLDNYMKEYDLLVNKLKINPKDENILKSISIVKTEFKNVLISLLTTNKQLFVM